MDRLHFLRKSANERIDGEASKTRDAHAQCNSCGYTKPMQMHRRKWRRVVVSKTAAGSAGCSHENWRPLTGEPWKGAHCAASRQRKAPLLQLIVAVLVHCRERITAGLGEVEHASRSGNAPTVDFGSFPRLTLDSAWKFSKSILLVSLSPSRCQRHRPIVQVCVKFTQLTARLIYALLSIPPQTHFALLFLGESCALHARGCRQRRRCEQDGHTVQPVVYILRCQ
jgi:hypothetical protein